MGLPPKDQESLAGGYDPDVSQRILWDLPADNKSFGVTILTLFGFTITKKLF